MLRKGIELLLSQSAALKFPGAIEHVDRELLLMFKCLIMPSINGILKVLGVRVTCLLVSIGHLFSRRAVLLHHGGVIG